ncbi:MAG: type II secretion system protein GspK [Phycisphaeraceae bacterium]
MMPCQPIQQARTIARPSHRQRGVALVLTLLICIVLVSLALTYGRAMRVELQAAANYQASAEATAVARGAVEAVLVMGDDVPVEAVDIGEGTFWIIRPNYDDDRTHAFGLVDEGGKINLNVADRETLEKLPLMDDQLASAVLEWRGDTGGGDAEGDEDSEGDAPAGGLVGGGEIKGEPFESVAELLMIHRFTPIVVFGEDANRNGILDANEDDGDTLSPPDHSDGRLHRGLWDFVTIWSRPPPAPQAADLADDDDDEGLGLEETPDAPGGSVNVDVNSSSSSTIRRAIEPVFGEARAGEIASRIRSTRPHRNIIDLMYNAQITAEELVTIESLLSVGRSRGGGGGGGGGRGGGGGAIVNINTAPRAVLAALPGLDEADADALIAHRESGGLTDPQDTLEAMATGDVMASVAWITQVLEREKAIRVGDVATTRSFVRSADIVAVNSDGRAFERIRIVVDFSEGDGRLLAWQRLTHLGWPLPRDWQQQLRDGTAGTDLQTERSSGVTGWQ